MYSKEAIASLIDRLGFGKGPSIPIDESNSLGTSGRLFSYYHKLVTIKNIYETLEYINSSEVEFNSYLQQLKTDSVKAILTEILNKNTSYQSTVDYSDTILKHPELFDDAIGYSVAICSIEQMITTTRINATVRKAEGAYQSLKIELEGLKVDGVVRSVGIKSNLKTSIKKASSVIFPEQLIITSKRIW